MAVLVAAETHGALRVAEGLPTMGDLAHRAGEGPGMAEAERIWTESWTEGADRGGQLRMDAYRMAGPVLTEALGPDGVRDLLVSVNDVLDAASELDPTELPAFIVEGLIEGEVLSQEAEQSLGAGDLDRAMLLTLQASDRLRALAPAEVAEALLREAEGALGRNGADAPYTELDLERSRHLLISAGEAMDGGDYLRAIRRAYYACQLLGVELQ